ncbi:hypothetical protein DIPPA_12928 [Diplonema papillatum]|nr:hypothetical protein DIPPA_12928 [Diplonema papillatum]
MKIPNVFAQMFLKAAQNLPIGFIEEEEELVGSIKKVDVKLSKGADKVNVRIELLMKGKVPNREVFVDFNVSAAENDLKVTDVSGNFKQKQAQTGFFSAVFGPSKEVHSFLPGFALDLLNELLAVSLAEGDDEEEEEDEDDED